MGRACGGALDFAFSSERTWMKYVCIDTKFFHHRQFSVSSTFVIVEPDVLPHISPTNPLPLGLAFLDVVPPEWLQARMLITRIYAHSKLL